jgi:hypothetical protein
MHAKSGSLEDLLQHKRGVHIIIRDDDVRLGFCH